MIFVPFDMIFQPLSNDIFFICWRTLFRKIIKMLAWDYAI